MPEAAGAEITKKLLVQEVLVAGVLEALDRLWVSLELQTPEEVAGEQQTMALEQTMLVAQAALA